MKIDIQSPGFAPGQELIHFLHEKMKKLSCLYGEIIGSEVCLRLDNSATKENKICSIRLFIPGNDLLASAQYKRFEQAIAQVVEILERQIKKRKTKEITRRKGNIKTG
jgi:putative sigma-54 modulation protein